MAAEEECAWVDLICYGRHSVDVVKALSKLGNVYADKDGAYAAYLSWRALRRVMKRTDLKVLDSDAPWAER